MSDQTYYKYCKKILEAYHEIETAEAETPRDETHIHTWQEALGALMQRVELAHRVVPSREELEQPPRKRQQVELRAGKPFVYNPKVAASEEAVDNALVALQPSEMLEKLRVLELPKVKAAAAAAGQTDPTLEVERIVEDKI